MLLMSPMSPNKESGNNKSTSGNITASSAKLLFKSGNLQVKPVSTAQPLPRSCWNLGAAAEDQNLQSRRFAQDLEKICGATDTFAAFAKAPGARWHRKDWTTKITNQNKTKWHCGRLWQLTPIYRPSKTLTNRTTSQVSPNVIYQQSSTLLMRLMSPMSPNKENGNNKSTSGNITASSAKLLIKAGNLQVKPFRTAQPLPRSCWNLGASVEVQLLQSRRFAQDLEKICGATDTFAAFAKAPGARWHRKDWTTKITNQNKTKWHCGRLWQLTPIYRPSKTLTNRTTSQVSPNVIYQQSSTLLMLLMSPMSPNKESGNNKSTSGNITASSAKVRYKDGNLQVPPSRHRAAAATQLLESGSICRSPTPSNVVDWLKLCSSASPSFAPRSRALTTLSRLGPGIATFVATSSSSTCSATPVPMGINSRCQRCWECWYMEKNWPSWQLHSCSIHLCLCWFGFWSRVVWIRHFSQKSLL